MPNRSNYKTKQRDLILSCLKENKSQHITAEGIMDSLKYRGEPVGQTTVYRNLDKLVKEGLVIRYAPHALGVGACYQYVGGTEICSPCCHLICTDCGCTTHLECEYLNDLSRHMRDNHNFNLDNNKTVLYGLCNKCATVK